MKRGDVVVCVVAGDYGKPRPAVIVQSDAYNEADYTSIVVYPITSALTNKSFRLQIPPSFDNGLKITSEAMIDKLVAVCRDKIHQQLGTLDTTIVLKVS
jgi:mRNA interferase MazF